MFLVFTQKMHSSENTEYSVHFAVQVVSCPRREQLLEGDLLAAITCCSAVDRRAVPATLATLIPGRQLWPE